MSIKVQLDGNLAGQNSEVLDAQAPRLWEQCGKPILVVAELIENYRVEPRPALQKDARIKLGIEHCQVALNPEQEHLLRNVMKALYSQRTASGTFDELTGTAEYDQQVLDGIEGHMDATEAVRVRTAMQAIAKRLAELGRKNDGDYPSLRREVKKLGEIVRRVLDEQLELDPKSIAEAELIKAAAVVEAEEAAQLADAQNRLEQTTDDAPESDE